MNKIDILFAKHKHDFEFLSGGDTRAIEFIHTRLKRIIKEAYDLGSADGYAECYHNYNNNDYENK